ILSTEDFLRKKIDKSTALSTVGRDGEDASLFINDNEMLVAKYYTEALGLTFPGLFFIAGMRIVAKQELVARAQTYSAILLNFTVEKDSVMIDETPYLSARSIEQTGDQKIEST